MKKRNLIIYIIFTLVVLFTMLPEAKAEEQIGDRYDVCSYIHPQYNDCRIVFRRSHSGEYYDWRLEKSNAMNDQCALIKYNGHDTAITEILPNTVNNPNFFEEYGEKYSNKCPTLYVGPTIYRCVDKYDDSGRPLTAYCLFVYLNNNANGSRVAMNGKLTANLINSEAVDEIKDAINPPKDEDLNRKIDELSAIKIGNTVFSCEKLLSDEVLEVIEIIFLLIRIVAPIILIVLTMLDYTSAIAAGEDALSKSNSKFIKRMIATVLVFLAPTFINFLMDISGISDGTCGF